MAVDIRKNAKKGHAIRWCYLISKHSEKIEEMAVLINIAKYIGADSVRFSIPFNNYNKTFESVRDYKYLREIPDNERYIKLLEPFLSKSMDEKPYIFYTPPDFTYIDRFTFNKCACGYYQITLGADGYFYKCSTTATPTAKQCRLGKMTTNISKFKALIKANQDSKWNCQSGCFENGLRCNRMALEICTEYEKTL